jgi:DNA-binding transcriptional regulator YiaG
MVMLTKEQIRELRDALELSVYDFAKKLGVSIDAVYRWERGQRHPSWRQMQKLNKMWAEAERRGLLQVA